MRKLLGASVLLSLLHLPAAFASVAGECVKDLEYLPTFLLRNDAGARDHLVRIGKSDLSRAFAQARRMAAKASTERECDAALNFYLSAWRSGHLSVKAIKPDTDPDAPATGPVIGHEPRIEFPSSETALLVINSFHPRAGRLLREELERLADQLSARTNWIIDVRRNAGGSDSAYQPLLHWLLEDEVVEVQLAFLATEANIQSTREACRLYAPDDESCVEFMKPVLESMINAPLGSYAATGNGEIRFIRVPESSYDQPDRVAVLTGENCVSSCEQFLLTVRQSFKVKLIGRNSRGNLDYGNLRPHPLPSGKRQIIYATSRSYRLPDMPVDGTGVMPDIYLPKPKTVEDWDDEIRRVRNWLEGGSLAPEAPSREE